MSVSSWRVTEAGGWLCLFWVITILFQWLGGAYHSELGSSYPDEPAHYITALMIRDFLASGHWTHPVAFAENYYLHYPKVAFGIWGPALQILGAVWMILFSPSRTSILLLMALITASIATSLFIAARPRFSLPAGLIIGVVLITAPDIQVATFRVMADSLVALFDLLAALAFARFLDSRRSRDAVVFGILTALSILTKGSGVALVLLPPIAILITRRWEILKTRGLWYAAGIVLALAGPWQFYTLPILSRFIVRRAASMDNAAAYLTYAAHFLGVALVPLVLLGMWAVLIRPARKELDGFWVSMGALLLAILTFHSIIPNTTEPRHILGTVAPLILFAAAGIAWLAERLPEKIPSRWQAPALACLALVIFSAQTFAIPQKRHAGYDELARDLMAPAFRDSIVLISSTGFGEGMLVSEVAMQDEHRPQHIVLRATKVLSVSNWEGEFYHQRQSTPAEVMDLLRSIPVDVVVVDLNSPHPEMTAHQLLMDTLREYSPRFQLLGRYPRGPNPTIEAYKLIGSETLPRGKIHLELPYTLGRPIDGQSLQRVP